MLVASVAGNRKRSVLRLLPREFSLGGAVLPGRGLHRQAPLALARAAAELGITRFVQISALGEPRYGDFIATRTGLLDDKVLNMGVDVRGRVWVLTEKGISVIEPLQAN